MSSSQEYFIMLAISIASLFAPRVLGRGGNGGGSNGLKFGVVVSLL
jgi:hypothetical protein